MKITKLIDEEREASLAKEQFAKDIEEGLSKTPKSISSKYFYDDRGSKIFQQITKLDEYYLSRAELTILENIKYELADAIGPEVDIIELGVGDGHKTKILIESFLQKKIKVHYFPIDISSEAIQLLEKNMQMLNDLEVHAIIGDYAEGLRFARGLSKNKQIVLFLGSTIGNFSREEEEILLKTIKSAMHKNDLLLIGFDLKKNPDFMTRAYSDSFGVTAEFNYNLLNRINTELNAKFEKENFKHLAFYNPILGAMESYLLSLVDQEIEIKKLNKTFHFKAFEPIHLEYSFKFLEEEIVDLSQRGGFRHLNNFRDPNNYFVDALWQV